MRFGIGLVAAYRSRTTSTVGSSQTQQTTEFVLLQQGVADFAIGSTINWSSQVKELNLFALPFMFPGYAGRRCRAGRVSRASDFSSSSSRRGSFRSPGGITALVS